MIYRKENGGAANCKNSTVRKHYHKSYSYLVEVQAFQAKDNSLQQI